MNKKVKRMLAVLTCTMTAVAFMPTFAFATDGEEQETAKPEVIAAEEIETVEETEVPEEVKSAEEVETVEAVNEVQTAAQVKTIKVTVNGVDKGTMLGLKTITVRSDAFDEAAAEVEDCDNIVTFADVITTYSKAIGKETKLEKGQNGLFLVKLFGDDSGNFFYYINDNMAWSAADPVSDAGNVTAFVFKNADYSDKYSYFDMKAKTVEKGEKLSIKLTACGYDANWNLVSEPFENAQVGYYSGNSFVKLGTTDANGKATVKLSGAGTYTLTANSDEKTLVPAYCVVTVSAKHLGLKHVKVAAGNLKNGYEYDNCTRCGATKLNYKTLAGWSTSYVKSFKVSKGKKCFTAKWAKQSSNNRKHFNGYQIAYSTDKSMKKGVKYAYAGNKTKAKKVRKLAKKKYYYVKVRTYTKSGKNTFYSKWSAVKAVKTR